MFETLTDLRRKMKKAGTPFLCMLATFLLLGCGINSDVITLENDSVQDTSTENESSISEEDPEEMRKTYEKNIVDPYKPEVIMVSLSGVCRGRIDRKVSISDIYGMNVMHSGIVGLVGVPVEVCFENVDNAELTFTYDEDSLRGIPETNLIMLHYDERAYYYKTVRKTEVDTENNTVTAPIKKEGVYLLVDAYQWFSCWGMDVSEYEYDINPSAFESDWERKYDTGSIMELADKEWAYENAPDFIVSDAQDLASVVYYVNSRLNDREEIHIVITDDIDLGGYRWMPMGWYNNGTSHQFYGTVDGCGHTISNMNIHLGYDECGFIGYSTYAVVRDITFADAYVSGTASTGIVGGEIYGTSLWENVHTDGVIDGGDDDYGGIIGSEVSITFKDCSTEVLINGEECDYVSYRQKLLNETKVIETFNLILNDDYSISRDEHEGFKGLGWHIELDGIQVLDRLAENETELSPYFQWIQGMEGIHTIYLTAWVDGVYVRVSNIIEYQI